MLRSLHLRFYRIQRVARGDEERSPVLATEAKVRASLGKIDLRDQRAVRRKHIRAVAEKAKGKLKGSGSFI